MNTETQIDYRYFTEDAWNGFVLLTDLARVVDASQGFMTNAKL